VAILPLNFKRRTAFQIYDKLSYEERTRHFWVGAVIGWPFHSVFVSASAGYYAEVEQDSSFD